jgi:hypothetical protein
LTGKYEREIEHVKCDGETCKWKDWERHLWSDQSKWKFDRVLLCTGWQHNTSIYSPKTKPEPATPPKYPKINKWFESSTTPGLYYAGTAAHSIDWRRSSGGFIHGFRYTVRSLHHILEWRHHSKRWPIAETVNASAKDVAGMLLSRVNQASGTYQMFAFLYDVVIFHKPNASGASVSLLHEVPEGLVDDVVAAADDVAWFMTVTFKWHPDFHGPEADVFAEDRSLKGDADRADESKFVHPVMQLYCPTADGKSKHFRDFHLLEDLYVEFTHPFMHLRPIFEFLEPVLASTPCSGSTPSSRPTPAPVREELTREEKLEQAENVAKKLAERLSPEQITHMISHLQQCSGGSCAST